MILIFGLIVLNIAVFDDVGHGIRSGSTPRQKQRGSSQGSIQSLTANSIVGPAPTTKPPTPPQVTRTGSKGNIITRTRNFNPILIFLH